MSSTTTTDPNYKPKPGHLGNLSAEQQKALDTFKNELKQQGAFVEERMDDALLLRFLRARKFDVALAKTMLLSAEQWRKDFGVEEIVKSFDYKEKAEVDKYYPQFYHKTDKDGRPIYIERFGQLDINKLYQCTTQERQLQRLVWEYEKSISTRLPACSASAGHPVETFCTILDLRGVTLRSFWNVKDFVMNASKIGQDRYPETMGKFYIVGAPYLFGTVWAVVKRWLDEVTVAKIAVLSGDVKDWKGALLEQIPPENLPHYLGGVCDCQGKGGCSMSDAGPWNQ
ncbi:hypothetical protein K435DRAFT_656941 [Dendrothele bispora CBS 962.96]|uniref:CRAL-TRIO domain-containing protein n=1 Tax=Dendrothele bispora (strain CBS 962.96) TaxID=1314807 RepID=A0A4S8MDF2_DENBC|nr:hypothetical protein K435DRAFT_656941 [Dendrothele bispora CBS 962.96]